MKTLITVAVAVVAVTLASPIQAGESANTGEHGQQFLITTTHTPEQCLSALDELAAKKMQTLAKMQWGCMAGDHTGYAFVEATDEAAALEMLPEANRKTAKAIRLTRFTPEKLKEIHAKMDSK